MRLVKPCNERSAIANNDFGLVSSSSSCFGRMNSSRQLDIISSIPDRFPHLHPDPPSRPLRGTSRPCLQIPELPLHVFTLRTYTAGFAISEAEEKLSHVTSVGMPGYVWRMNPSARRIRCCIRPDMTGASLARAAECSIEAQEQKSLFPLAFTLCKFGMTCPAPDSESRV